MDAPPPPVVVEVSVGPAYLAKSPSHAVPHLLKPAARLGARVAWARFELGGDVVALLDRSEHYRVLGALGRGRYAVWQRPRWSAGVAAGVGGGYDADILHADLTAPRALAVYGLVAADARWAVGGSWHVGTELSWWNLAVAHVGLIVGRRFGGVP